MVDQSRFPQIVMYWFVMASRWPYVVADDGGKKSTLSREVAGGGGGGDGEAAGETFKKGSPKINTAKKE